MATPGRSTAQMATTRLLSTITDLYSLMTGELPLILCTANATIFGEPTNSQCVTVTKHNSPDATVFNHKCELLSFYPPKKRAAGAILYGPNSTFITKVQSEDSTILRLHVPTMMNGLLDPTGFLEIRIPNAITFCVIQRTAVFRPTAYGLHAIDEADPLSDSTATHELQVLSMNLRRANWCVTHREQLVLILANLGRLSSFMDMSQAVHDEFIGLLMSEVDLGRNSDSLLSVLDSLSAPRKMKSTHLYVPLAATSKTGATQVHIRDAISGLKDIKYHFHWSESSVIPRTCPEFGTYVETQFGDVTRIITAPDFVKATLQGFQTPEHEQQFGQELYYHFIHDCGAERIEGEYQFKGLRVNKLIGMIIPLVIEARPKYLRRKDFSSSQDCPWATLVQQACEVLQGFTEAKIERSPDAYELSRFDTSEVKHQVRTIRYGEPLRVRPEYAHVLKQGIHRPQEVATPLQSEDAKQVIPDLGNQAEVNVAADSAVVVTEHALSPVPERKKKVGVITTAYSTFFGSYGQPRFETTDAIVPACGIRVEGSTKPYFEPKSAEAPYPHRLAGITCLYSTPKVSVTSVKDQSEQTVVGSFAVRISNRRGDDGPKFFGLDSSLDSHRDDIYGRYYVLNFSFEESASRGSTSNTPKRGGGVTAQRSAMRSDDSPKIVVSMLTQAGKPKPPIGIIVGKEKIDQPHHISKIHRILVKHEGADFEDVAMVQHLAVSFVRRLSGDAKEDVTIDVDDVDTSIRENF